MIRIVHKSTFGFLHRTPSSTGGIPTVVVALLCRNTSSRSCAHDAFSLHRDIFSVPGHAREDKLEPASAPLTPSTETTPSSSASAALPSLPPPPAWTLCTRGPGREEDHDPKTRLEEKNWFVIGEEETLLGGDSLRSPQITSGNRAPPLQPRRAQLARQLREQHVVRTTTSSHMWPWRAGRTRTAASTCGGMCSNGT